MPRVTDVLFYAIVAAMIMMMVRPGSPSTLAVQAVSSGIAGLVGAVTGVAS